MSIDEYIDNVLGEAQQLCRLIGLRTYFINKRLEGVANMFKENIDLAIAVHIRSLLGDKKYADDICIHGAIKYLYKNKKITHPAYIKMSGELKKIKERYTDSALQTLTNKALLHSTTKRKENIQVKQQDVDDIVDSISNYLYDNLYPHFYKNNEWDFQAKREIYETGYWDTDMKKMLKSNLIHEI